MAGHVFIVPGSIRRLACDAWLIPCSRSAKPDRFRPEHWPRGFAWPKPPDPDQWYTWRQRAFRIDLPTELRHEPRAWLVNVGYNPDSGQGEEEFYEASVREALRKALADLRPPYVPHRRVAPLLAMPFLGSGHGMRKRYERGRLLEALLKVVRSEMDRVEETIDVALVTYGAAATAAAQHARESLGWGWPDLDGPLRQHAARLAERAERDSLAAFLGAGVGVGAGLPTWNEMIDRLGTKHNLPPEVRKFLQDPARDVLDRASYLAAVIGGPAVLRDTIRDVIRGHPRYSLSHGLLAGLPVTEAITTNYDELFEWAWQGVDAEGPAVPTSYIPHRWTADHRRWLLKLHGCVTAPESIVLTRENYIRFSHQWAALEGLLQATLLNRHVLFVGFSLSDPNFIRILDAVRRIVRPAEAPALKGRPFGTALMIKGDEMLRYLYQHDVEWLSLGDESRAGRRLELFLDCLLARTRAPAHLLDDDFESLSRDDEPLRKELLRLAAALPSGPRSPAWDRVEALLREFGWRPR
jgi:hypothetical protein